MKHGEDNNADSLAFTPETLRQLSSEADDLRMRCLFDVEDAGAEALAEQHYLKALAFLDLAQREFATAAIHQMRATR